MSEFNFDHPCTLPSTPPPPSSRPRAHARSCVVRWGPDRATSPTAAAIDWALLVQKLNCLKDPKAGPVDIPEYDFVTHSRYAPPHMPCRAPTLNHVHVCVCRLKQTTSVYGADVIILEGILIFHNVRRGRPLAFFSFSFSSSFVGGRSRREICST